jgi:hypothetical protein
LDDWRESWIRNKNDLGGNSSLSIKILSTTKKNSIFEEIKLRIEIKAK